MEVKRKLSEFLKRETVLTVAILLAIVSAVMIPPDREYAGYIDFRTLSILFLPDDGDGRLAETGCFP